MSSDVKALARRWFEEVWNQGREETIDELLPADGIGHSLGESGVATGPEGFKAFWRNMRCALPDLQVSIEDVLADGDKGVVRLVLTGTHRGDGLGFPATGRRVSVGGIIMLRVAHGRIAEAWNAWDQLGLLQQLGVVPGPPGGQDRFLTARLAKP